MKKYKLTDETKEVDGHILHRIQALSSFSNVKAGAKQPEATRVVRLQEPKQEVRRFLVSPVQWPNSGGVCYK